MTIFVGNLSEEVREGDIKEIFAEYGRVKRVRLPIDRETSRIRGFAFVDMGSEEQEAVAIETLDGSELMGFQLRVHKARPGSDRDSSSTSTSTRRDRLS